MEEPFRASPPLPAAENDSTIAGASLGPIVVLIDVSQGIGACAWALQAMPLCFEAHYYCADNPDALSVLEAADSSAIPLGSLFGMHRYALRPLACLLYTSDAADE